MFYGSSSDVRSADFAARKEVISMANNTTRVTRGLPPGTSTPQSGQYRNDQTRQEVTSTKGNPLPPGPKGSKYDLVDLTCHKRD